MVNIGTNIADAYPGDTITFSYEGHKVSGEAWSHDDGADEALMVGGTLIRDSDGELNESVRIESIDREGEPMPTDVGSAFYATIHLDEDFTSSDDMYENCLVFIDAQGDPCVLPPNNDMTSHPDWDAWPGFEVINPDSVIVADIVRRAPKPRAGGLLGNSEITPEDED